MANQYENGDQVRLTVTFANSAGTNTDPTAIVFKYRNPAGTISTKTYALGEVTKSATGVYYIDLSLTSDGEWHYRAYGTGNLVAAAEGKLTVSKSVFS